MALTDPDVSLNAVMAKVYDVLTNGDDTVPRSEDNFFSWCTPGIPLEAEDVRFVRQGLTGVVRKEAVQEITGSTPSEAGESEDGAAAAPALSPEQLETLRATDAGQLLQQAEAFARLVDFVPDVTANTNDRFQALSVMNNEGSLSQRFEFVLRWSQVCAHDLPEETKAKIEKFRGLLQTVTTKKNIVTDEETEVTEPSALVKLYNEKMADYEAAALSYNNARLDAMAATNQRAVQNWAINANILRNRVRAAHDDWVSNGYKNEFEQISAFISQVMNRDMALIKRNILDDLERARLTGITSGSDFFYSAMLPANVMESSGWTKFSFSASEFAKHSQSSYKIKSQKSTGRAGWFGVFQAKGGHHKTTSDAESEVKIDMSRFSMSFEMAQVQIARPWFNTAFLSSRGWRMDPQNPEGEEQALSDGGNPPKGLIPAYPTAIILVRDLKMYFGESHGIREQMSKYKNEGGGGGLGFRWGLFNIGGSHHRNTTTGEKEENYEWNAEDQSIEVKGTQIIGFKCHVLPKAPDPLPNIENWV